MLPSKSLFFLELGFVGFLKMIRIRARRRAIHVITSKILIILKNPTNPNSKKNYLAILNTRVTSFLPTV
jgi:hypothetical protein